MSRTATILLISGVRITVEGDYDVERLMHALIAGKPFDLRRRGSDGTRHTTWIPSTAVVCVDEEHA